MNARPPGGGPRQTPDAPTQAGSRSRLDRRAKPRVHAQRTDPRPPVGEPESVLRGRPGELLTIDDVTAELQVSRTAFYRWRRQGTGPPVLRLPGGGLRVRRAALAAWLAGLEDEPPEEEFT